MTDPVEHLEVQESEHLRSLTAAEAEGDERAVEAATHLPDVSTRSRSTAYASLGEARQMAGMSVGAIAAFRRARELAGGDAVRQAEQKGLGHAVLQARHHVGDHPFVCQLGDAIFSPKGNAELPCQQMVAAYRELKTPIIGLFTHVQRQRAKHAAGGNPLQTVDTDIGDSEGLGVNFGDHQYGKNRS